MKRIVIVFLVFVMIISSSACIFAYEQGSMQEDRESGAEKRLLIVYKEDVPRTMSKMTAVAPMLNESQPKIINSKRLENLNMEIITIDEEEEAQNVIDLLMKDESIESVQEDVRRDYLSIPNDPLYEFQWGLTNENINISKAWELVEGGDEVVVAVIDSGIYTEHEDLRYRIISGGRSFSYHYSDSNTNDTDGHGTRVAGVIAAQTNNSTGIAGVSGESNVSILPLKVGLTAIDLVSAIDYAVAMEVDVINISMGGLYYEPEEKAIQRAIDNNIVVVAAVGNEGHGKNEILYPAGFWDVISVGAIDSNEDISYFSNHNSAVDIAAPGEGIFTTDISGDYRQVDGTSFASPFVAGVCAMLKSMDKSLTPSEIEGILISTARDRGEEGRDDYYGHGIINPIGAINSILIEDEEYEYVDDISNVPLDKEWTISFNTQLNSDTINASNIYIIDSKYSFVGCNLSLSSDKKSVVITPEADYRPDEEYYLIINRDVKSVNDKSLVKSVRMKFTTGD